MPPVDRVTIKIPHELIKSIILKHVLEKYGKVLDVQDFDQIDWNHYSLLTGEDGLSFQKK